MILAMCPKEHSSSSFYGIVCSSGFELGNTRRAGYYEDVDAHAGVIVRALIWTEALMAVQFKIFRQQYISQMIKLAFEAISITLSSFGSDYTGRYGAFLAKQRLSLP